jgi:hypothetical protein
VNEYPVGNQVECLFAFTTRPLTEQERNAFLAGSGLPAGVGIDQTTVMMDYKLNDGTPTTLSGASIIHDAAGAYHAVITLATRGSWKYHGYSVDGGGNPVAATEPNVMEAIQF